MLRLKKLIRLGKGFARHMSRANVNAYAASAAFFIFLSLIPIIIVFCSLLPYTPLQKSDLQQAVNQVMPMPMVSFMLPLIDSVYNSTVGVLSIAAVVTVWSAGKGMLALMRGLNAMNGVVEDRNYVVQRALASLYTVIMLLLLLLSLVLMVFGNTLVRVLDEYIPMLEEMVDFLMLFKPLFSWGILTGAFMLIYANVPNVKLKVKNQFPGALFSAIAWNVFSAGFSVYIETFNDFSLYGSLSAIVVIMLWIYTCMYLLLIGAHINRFVVPFRREILGRP